MRALGLSDIDTCECCGRTGLKRTVILAQTDGDGNVYGPPIHYGTVCAARATGRRDILRTAEAAESARQRVAQQVRGYREMVALLDDVIAEAGDRPGRAMPILVQRYRRRPSVIFRVRNAARGAGPAEQAQVARAWYLAQIDDLA